MGSCTRRHFLLTICTFQLITIIERQVFDFLGFMWAPILANFFHIICVIFGFFGCYQFRAKYIVTYAIWNLFWIGWNALLVCFYLSVGVLDKDSVLLNFGSVSWFESNGFGCQPVFSTNLTADVPVWPIRPERVDNCLLSYEWVEIGHSGVQLALSVLALLGSILITKMFYDEDDRSTYKSGGSTKSSTKSKHRQSLYSIEFSPPMDTIRGGGGGAGGLHHHHHHHSDDLLDAYDTTNELGAVGGPPLSPKPMTPRRVKRRSVMTRGTTGRQSTTSRHAGGGGSGGGTTSRQSQRASRRKYHQSTVTKLMEQQQQQQQQQQHQYSSQHQQQHPHNQATTAFQHNASTHTASQRRYPTFQRTENPALTESNLKYLNTDPPVDSAHHTYGTTAGTAMPAASGSSGHRYTNSAAAAAAAPPPPDPIYYNMEPSNSALMQHHSQQIQHQHNQHSMQSSHMGHYNPTYQHSNPNLSAMPLEPATPADDLFAAPQHRPPSVRSSYSNFHGTRHLSSLTSDTENVFASLSSREQHQHQHQQQQLYELQQNMNLPPPPPPLASAVAGGGGGGSASSNASAQPAAPYLPPRKSASRESIRFLNNGPPAYNLNYHTPPDSETTM